MTPRRKLRILVAIGVVALLGLGVLLVSEPYSIPAPPIVTVVSAEPAGMIDASGTELLMLTIAINNTNRLGVVGNQDHTTLWIKESVKPTEARIRNRWSAAPPATPARTEAIALVASRAVESTLFVPVGTDSCRVRLQYTGSRFSYPPTPKGMSLAIMAKLPQGLRSRIPSKFRRWAGFARPWPDPEWRELCVELPISPTNQMSRD